MSIAGVLLAQDEPRRAGDVFTDPGYRQRVLRQWIEQSRVVEKPAPGPSAFDLQSNKMAESWNRFAEKARGGIIDRQLLEAFYKEVHKLETLKP